jgi:hypothetical protein
MLPFSASAPVDKGVAFIAVFQVIVRMHISDAKISQNFFHGANCLKGSPSMHCRLLDYILQGSVNLFLAKQMAILMGRGEFRCVDHRGSSILLQTSRKLNCSRWSVASRLYRYEQRPRDPYTLQ